MRAWLHSDIGRRSRLFLGATLWALASSLATGCSGPPVTDKPPTAEPLAAQAALTYALAFRDGKWDDAIDRTCWAVERLARVRASTGTNDAVETERAVLRQRLSTRVIEANQLREEGADDQYVFAPGARMEVLRDEPGRADIGAWRRVWLRVTYSDRAGALRGEASAPIHSISVGVSVTREGLVAKAALLGNLEIDRASISYEWK